MVIAAKLLLLKYFQAQNPVLWILLAYNKIFFSAISTIRVKI